MIDSNTQITGGVGEVSTKICSINLPEGGFRLELGGVLSHIDVAYETYGKLSESCDNAVFICHALTGDANAAGKHADAIKPGWWDNMIGPGRGIDTNRFFVICANILGGCKGTTGPSSVNPATGKPYGSSFPDITVQDIVDVHKLLLDKLGIKKLHSVIGGSFGGMQTLDFAIRYPDFIDSCVCIASGSSLNSQALAFDLVGRAAIEQDPNWNNGDYYDGVAPVVGLAQARKLAHITYLSQEMINKKSLGPDRKKQKEAVKIIGEATKKPYDIESYLEHQGESFIKRFDANSYLKIVQAMDTCDLAKKYGSIEKAFESIKSRILIVALSGDWLFLPQQSTDMVSALLLKGKQVSYCGLDAPAGHDAFLTDIDELTVATKCFLAANPAITEDPSHQLSDDEKDLYDKIINLIPGTAKRVLDLGCGDGALLNHISNKRPDVRGTGVDFNFESIVIPIHHAHGILLTDIDNGLKIIPDGSYDCAVLSQTLQVMKHPKETLVKMLKIAPVGIVSFPNFAHWSVQWSLFSRGRMPESKSLPEKWYNTANIHLCTLKDFTDLCDELGIEVEKTIYLSHGPADRFLISSGFPNFGAPKVLVRIRKKH